MKNKALFFLVVMFIYIIAVSPTFAKANLPGLIKKISPSVVVIVTFDEKGEVLAQGSGFFINKQGDIITNYHVIEGASSAEVKTAEGDIYHIDSILSQDIESDLIKLSIKSPQNNIVPLSLSKDIPEVGEQIAVIGCPLGLEKTASTGIVSAVREIPHFGKIIQIDAAISPGSSGSPVVNMKGKVIGVATFQIVEGQNLNFAVPTKKILSLSQNKVLQLSELQTIDEKKKMLYGTSYASLILEQDADCYSLYEKEDYEAAITCFEEKIKKNPNDWLAYFFIANCMALLERPEEEKEILRQAGTILEEQVKKNPKNPVIHCFLGYFYGELEQPEKSKEEYKKAILCYEQMIEKNPNDYRAYREIGGIYYLELNNVEASIEAYKKALRINPYDANIYRELAEKYTKVQNREEAIEAYTKALELQPNNIETCYSFAEYLTTLKMYNESIELNKHFKNMARIYDSNLENYPKALEYYKQAIKLKPANAWLYGRLASVYEEMGQYENAVGAYKQVILLEPNSAYYYHDLAQAYCKLGNYQEAIESYKKAIKISIDNIDDEEPDYYCFLLGNIYFKISDYKNAIVYHKRAIEIDPDYAEAYCALGDDYFALNTFAKAVKAYKQAIKLNSNYSDAHYKLGLSYIKLGNTVSAVEQYKILKPLDSNLAPKLKDELIKSGLWRQILKTFKYDFRNAKWGMTIKQVKKTEEGPVTFEGWDKVQNANTLEYEGYISSYHCYIAYIFSKTKLRKAQYLLETGYDADFPTSTLLKMFVNLLSEKYGEPIHQDPIEEAAYWETTSTSIRLGRPFLYNNKYTVSVEYFDKTTKDGFLKNDF